MANNKVQLANGTVLLDLTGDTVTPGDLRRGATAHAANGEQITGTHEDPVTSVNGKTGDVGLDAGDIGYNAGAAYSSGSVGEELGHKITIESNAGFHNSIYRGKQIGTSVSAAQWAEIAAGTFDDMFVGDYWTINGVNWRIAGFNYWVNANYSSTPHVVIVPDTNLASAPMNSTNTTAGAYYNCDFRTGANGNTGRATAISAVNSAFGSSHILTYKDYLHSAVTDGHPSGQEWADCTVELMNEEMVYGGHIFAPIANGTTVYSNYTTSKSQLPLFQHEHSRISNQALWWLRSVVSSAYFALVHFLGDADSHYASHSRGVRPAFGIC